MTLSLDLAIRRPDGTETLNTFLYDDSKEDLLVFLVKLRKAYTELENNELNQTQLPKPGQWFVYLTGAKEIFDEHLTSGLKYFNTLKEGGNLVAILKSAFFAIQDDLIKTIASKLYQIK